MTSRGESTHCTEILQRHLARRRERNSAYSLRAFARDLGMSQAYLSLLLAGKRRLSMKLANQLSLALKMTQTERKGFLQSAARERVGQLMSGAEPGLSGADGYLRLSADQFRVISEWYHLPILDLTLVKAFRPDIAWIARHLGITRAQARDAIHRLLRLGLLEKRGRTWVKSKSRIEFESPHSHEAIRSFHKQMIEKAGKELDCADERAFSRRAISGITVTVNERRLPEAIERIERFRKELADFVGEGECTDLFQFNLQFFSLLKPTEGDRK